MADKKAALTNRIMGRSAAPAQIERGDEYALSITTPAPELPANANELPERLKGFARQYIDARRKFGASLLEACRWLCEAKQEAVHGQWEAFLAAIKLDESRARAQMRIHERAMIDPAFAHSILSGSLSESVARELLSAPEELQQEVISSGKPQSLRGLRAAKRAAPPVLKEPSDPAHVARLEEQIESGDRIPEARMEIAPRPAPLPAVPPRPRRPRQPRSADASAQAEYNAQTELYMDQMDAYARALELVIMEIQRRNA